MLYELNLANHKYPNAGERDLFIYLFITHPFQRFCSIKMNHFVFARHRSHLGFRSENLETTDQNFNFQYLIFTSGCVNQPTTWHVLFITPASLLLEHVTERCFQVAQVYGLGFACENYTKPTQTNIKTSKMSTDEKKLF